MRTVADLDIKTGTRTCTTHWQTEVACAADPNGTHQCKRSAAHHTHECVCDAVLRLLER